MPKKAGPKRRTPKPTGELVPQPHGGKLWRGTPATVVPGPGRPRNETRARMRSALDEHGVDYVESVLRGDEKGATIQDRLAAFDRLAKYGLGALKGVSDEVLTEKVRETLQVVYDVLGSDGYTAALPRLQEIWTRK